MPLVKNCLLWQSVLSLSLVLLLNTAQARADGDGVPEYIPFNKPVIQSSSTPENIQLVDHLNKVVYLSSLCTIVMVFPSVVLTAIFSTTICRLGLKCTEHSGAGTVTPRKRLSESKRVKA